MTIAKISYVIECKIDFGGQTTELRSIKNEFEVSQEDLRKMSDKVETELGWKVTTDDLLKMICTYEPFLNDFKLNGFVEDSQSRRGLIKAFEAYVRQDEYIDSSPGSWVKDWEKVHAAAEKMGLEPFVDEDDEDDEDDSLARPEAP